MTQTKELPDRYYKNIPSMLHTTMHSIQSLSRSPVKQYLHIIERNQKYDLVLNSLLKVYIKNLNQIT